MTTLISIIVPVFNVERYLAACLESLLVQTYGEIEIICVEDASTDNSPGILNEAARRDPRIKVHRHENNRGLSAARNTGIAAAAGSWILFVDSDDIASPALCERALAAALCSDSDVVFFSHSVFRDGESPALDHKRAEVQHVSREALLLRKSFAWTKLVRASFLIDRGIKFPEGMCFEDIPVHWRLATESKMPVFLDEPLVCYRQRAGSITYRTDWSRSDSISAYDLVQRQLRQSGLWPQYGVIFMQKEMANFADTHAYYVVANPALLVRVREEASRRMTDQHWLLALEGHGLSTSQRDYILGSCRPRDSAWSWRAVLPVIRMYLRDFLRKVWHTARS